MKKASVVDKKPVVFLTGATGLVGSYLLKILLKNGHKVFVLARPKGDKNAKQRIAYVLNFWDKEVFSSFRKNLVVVEGDIAEKNFGLMPKELTRLYAEVEQIYHCAAVTDLNWPLNKIRKINVAGTKNILDFALKCPRLIKVNHISTAYVCGDYGGVFAEGDLDVGQKFNSTYEQSKFEAEKLVKKYRRKMLWIDIFRLPLVIGESKTGKIITFKNIYQFLSICKHNLFVALPIKNFVTNMIPVDMCSNAIAFIARESTRRNNTYHVFSNSAMFVEKILVRASQILGFKLPKIVSGKDFDIRQLSPIQKHILENNIFALNFLTRLNSQSTNLYLSSNGLSLEITDPSFNKVLSFVKNKWRRNLA
jgi:thioester reductase-like protein